MRKKRRQNLDPIRNTQDAYFHRNYGISIEYYEVMLEEQDHRCAICRTHVANLPERLVVDHCHKSSNVRGLLCQKCNTGLGFFKDSIPVLARAICYLEDNGHKRSLSDKEKEYMTDYE